VNRWAARIAPAALLGTSLAAKRPLGCGRLRGPSVSLCSRPRRASRPCRRAALTMTHVVDKHEPTVDRGLVAQWQQALGNAARASGEPLRFGLRLWASICLALYVAFWLQLDNAYWAGASAVIVCQPHLGASLRKGWFRMIGTVVRAVAIVVLTASFPQDRVAFLVGLALWGATCALGATLLRHFAAYAAALAGFTAAIIASHELGATGGVNGQAFVLAISRVSEIWIGLVCAGVVLATTDFGRASPRGLRCALCSVLRPVRAAGRETIGKAASTAGSRYRMKPHRCSGPSSSPGLRSGPTLSSFVRPRSASARARIDSAPAALAAGKSATPTAGFARLDQRLASLSPSGTGTSAVMRARGRILAISDTLTQHRSYFDAGVAS
jgi:hypothetical protein